MSKHWTVAVGLAGISDLRLEARFLWRKDRFVHRLVLVTPDAESTILQSVEGTDQEDFPPSPPLQDMSVERRVGSQVALGVGMAGSAMWSLSVEAPTGTGDLLFEWACQTRGALLWPKNCYLLSHDDRGANSTPNEVRLCRWHGPSGIPVTVLLTLEQTPATLPLGYTIADQEASMPTNTLLAVNDSTDGSVLKVEGKPADRNHETSKSETLRWQYRIALRTGVE